MGAGWGGNGCWYKLAHELQCGSPQIMLRIRCPLSWSCFPWSFPPHLLTPQTLSFSNLLSINFLRMLLYPNLSIATVSPVNCQVFQSHLSVEHYFLSNALTNSANALFLYWIVNAESSTVQTNVLKKMTQHSSTKRQWSTKTFEHWNFPTKTLLD